jgi:hypothetical protein
MEDFINYFLGTFVLIVPPFLLVRYIVLSIKHLFTAEEENSNLISQGIFHKIVSNPNAPGNKALSLSGRQNTFKTSSQVCEANLGDAIRFADFHTWLLKEGYIKNRMN